MHAILIDPENRTVTEMELNSDDYREINAVLHCHSHTTGAYLRGSIETGFDAVYVSDDPLEDRDDSRFWFQVDADRDPPSSYPIAGLGLALGTDTGGAGCNVGISVAELAARITFTQRKFRGVGPLKEIPGGFVPDFKAPIIDGADENKSG
jgi:hypothetical protein